MKTIIYEIRKSKDIIHSVKKITESKSIRILDLENFFQERSRLKNLNLLFFLKINKILFKKNES